VMSARQKSRDPASGERDAKNNDTRGFHYFSRPT
jgi:hypothetical protein